MIYFAQIVTYIAQISAAIVILVGVGRAIYIFVTNGLKRNLELKHMLSGRFLLGHSLSLGLSFLIGASILQSAVAPTWDDIGKLAAIIAVRTLLTYFLGKELKQLRLDIDS